MQEPSANNKFTFKIGPPTTKNIAPPNMIAMKRIDNYSYALTDQIGLGLTSHVYKGHSQITKQIVAVKVIDLKIKNGEDDLQSKFIAEEIAVLEKIKLADPTNLLKLQCVIQSKNNLYIITEFCEGNDVAKILRKKQRFNEKQAQSIMKQLLNGYKELYGLGIIHRDLKLANIFITKGIVKIADFGFATNEEICEKKLDYNVGSPYYMAPEALQSNKYSFSSDVWGIGVIAYQLFYGRVPWKDKDDQVLVTMMTNCPIQKLFDSDKQISQHYQQFVKKCLTIDISQRARPEDIINYQWPMAAEHVEGLEEPIRENRMFSLGRKEVNHGRSHEKIPRVKQVVNQKEVKTLNQIQRQKQRERNNSLNNKINASSLNKHIFGKKIISRANKPPSAERYSEDRINYIDIMTDPNPVLQNGPDSLKNNFQQYFRKPSDSTQKSKNISQFNSFSLSDSQKCSREAIIGQINYCRFIYHLYYLIGDKNFTNQSILMLKTEIASTIAHKMSILVQIAQKQQNNLKSPGFNTFIKTEEWKQLKDIIFKYNLRYQNDMKSQEIRAIEFFNQDRKKVGNNNLFKIIFDIKAQLPNNQKLLQFLTYYYQIREEDEKSNAHIFYEKTKLEYLIDEICYYRMQEKRNNIRFEDDRNEENIQRLIKKLELLGF